MTMKQVFNPTEADQNDDGQIRERNGIWVVTIDGVWRGDYTKREHAVAAVKAAWGAPHHACR